MLVRQPELRQCPAAQPNGKARPNRTQIILGVACLLAYAVGYPVAIIGDSPFGWVLVTLGGVFLFAFLIVTIRRINR